MSITAKKSTVEIIHLIDSPFYTKKTRYLTVMGSTRTFDLLVSTRFYPAVVPADGSLISLTVTTDEISKKVEEYRGDYNQIVTAELYETREKNNFVTYGHVFKHQVPEKLFQAYLYFMNFKIITSQPHLVKKSFGDRECVQLIGANRHFQWINHYQFKKEIIDTTFNIIMVRFSNESLRFA